MDGPNGRRLPSGLELLSGDVPACVAALSRGDVPVVWANDAFRALLPDVVDQPLGAVLGAPAAEAARSGAPSRVDTRLGIADVEVSITPLESGWAVCLLVDVDERTHEIRESRKEAGRLRRLIESVPAVIYRADWSEEAALRFISPQVEDLLGRPASVFTRGRAAWAGHLHPDDRDTYLAAEAQSFESERAFDTQYRMIDAQGQTKHVYEREAIVRDEYGHPRFSVGILIDVTHRRI